MRCFVHYHCLALLLATSLVGAAKAEAGLLRIVSYAVNTTIVSRFARTHISVVISNARNCSTVMGFTNQLPLNARVTELIMTASSDQGDCQLNGVVMAEEEARQEFVESASHGRPAALLQAYDAANYGVQVSLLPLGKTIVDFTLEELLQRKRGQIDFQVPLYPGLPVENLTMDVTIQEPRSGISKFGFIYDYDGVDANQLDTIQVVNTGANGSATAHFEAFDVAGTSYTMPSPLPRLLRAFYDSGPLPDDGLLLPNTLGTCFVHLFNPVSLMSRMGSLPRNIVFVIDVSGSMNGQKIADARAAFAAIIQKLTSDDYFKVQAFSNAGAERIFGPEQATDDAKQRGQTWVQDLIINGGTNLNDAYVQGIRQVQTMQLARGESASSYIPVVMILTDGEPTKGVTDPRQISQNVKQANHDGINAKVYGLAFGAGADFELLSGISMQNGGRAVRIYEGYGTAATQMEEFYAGELGTILMSDVNVSFDGNVMIDSQTQTRFPIVAEGSEVAVRARVLDSAVSGSSSEPQTSISMGVTTVANTIQGINTWRAELSMTDEPGFSPNQVECVQSFAHAKISELMLFRNAAIKLGDEMEGYYPLYALNNGMASTESQRSPGSSGGHQRVRRQQGYDPGIDLVRLAEDEALGLALEAGVVWPGLTAMVTVESESCSEVANNVEICDDDVYSAGNDNATSSYYEAEEGVAKEMPSASAPGAAYTAAPGYSYYDDVYSDMNTNGATGYGGYSGGAAYDAAPGYSYDSADSSVQVSATRSSGSDFEPPEDGETSAAHMSSTPVGTVVVALFGSVLLAFYYHLL